MTPDSPFDILILTNGPGEVTTWVRPVVKALRQNLGADSHRVRISIMLSPCPHATGQEAKIARSYTEVDRVQASAYFFDFLLLGKTVDNWDWRDRGIVVFLGGDQFFPLLIGKRLGYQTLIYAEWEARWYRWIDRFGAMNPSVLAPIPSRYHSKFAIVGDLMADVPQRLAPPDSENKPLQIALLPGSKPGKLAQGVPFCLAIAEAVHQQRPDIRFILPVAPTLDPETLAQYADPHLNPLIPRLGGVNAHLVALPLSDGSSPPVLKTSGGLTISLITNYPAHGELIQCQLALTTVGANTAELGSLAIPMIVLLPTQALDAMRNWDGLPGIIASLPWVGSVIAKGINTRVLRQGRLFAWPNLWAKEEIVPELIGELHAPDVAAKVLQLMDHPEQLQQIRDRLIAVRGKPGAAERLVSVIMDMMESD
jgi:lipid-A-disaccharide synthase